jgi:hypothetical protein
MRILTGFILSAVFVLTGVSAKADLLHCKIYDLATGQDLSEVTVTNFKLSQLASKPLIINLNGDLMSAEFNLSFNDEMHESLLFQIQTHEIRNGEYAKFIIPISNLKKNKAYELGRVFTEITDLGDNTMAYCLFTLK